MHQKAPQTKVYVEQHLYTNQSCAVSLVPYCLSLFLDHVIAWMQLVRDKLEDVGPDKRMVESLAPMWDEERQRCGGRGPPDPPPDPLRDPKPLCATVDFVRAQFQVICCAILPSNAA